MSAVIDTGVLVGALHARDAYHSQALPILRAADEGRIPPLWITDFVLAETLNYLVRKAGSSVARSALDRLQRSPGFRLDRVSDASFHVAKNELFATADGLSFVDCLTVAWMRAHTIRDLYSFDRGFDGVSGLRRLEALPPGRTAR